MHSRKFDGRRVVVAFVVMLFLLVVSMAAVWNDDARRLEDVGRSVAADGDRSIVIPLERGMDGTPIHVAPGSGAGNRRMSVTLLDDRMSGARHFRITGTPYEADATIAREFARYRVLRIAGDIDCVTGAVRWRNYEIAPDAVAPAVRTAPPLSATPTGLPSVLDETRTALICEVAPDRR